MWNKLQRFGTNPIKLYQIATQINIKHHHSLPFTTIVFHIVEDRIPYCGRFFKKERIMDDNFSNIRLHLKNLQDKYEDSVKEIEYWRGEVWKLEKKNRELELKLVNNGVIPPNFEPI